MGKRREAGNLGGTMFRFGTRLFEIWGKLQTLPPSKILDILRVGGTTVISGVGAKTDESRVGGPELCV